MANTSSRDIHYQADGATMVGRLALPTGTDTRPGILIAHEGPGLDDHQRLRAAQLAELGFVAFALDYHGGGRLILDREQMMTRLAELSADVDRIRTLATAGLQVLLEEPRVDRSKIAALGYCFGGTVVLELARTGADVKAVVGFHPGLASARPEDARNIRGKVLMCVGADDPLIPEEQRTAFQEEMRSGGVDWQMNLYGGAVHSFSHPNANRANMDSIRYDEKVDRRSWTAMLDLVGEVFGAPT